MLKDLIKQNRSYRAFDESVRVTKAQLLDFVDCARLTASTVNAQPLKYFLSYDSRTNGVILENVTFGKRLATLKLPPEGQKPSAFIVICCDTNIALAQSFMRDTGIVAQTMLLRATELSLGGCMLGSFKAPLLQRALGLPEGLEPTLVIAFGKPREQAVLTDVKNGDTGYYRDENNVHYVPKRGLDEIIINGMDISNGKK